MLAVIIIAFVDIDVTFNTFPLVGTDTHRFAINLIKCSTVLAAKTAVLTVCSVKTGVTIAFVRSVSASLFDPTRAAIQTGRADAVVLSFTNIIFSLTSLISFSL